MENMEKLKNMKMPRPGGAGMGLGALLGAVGLGVYTLSNCLFNVEGGHRAIVFNRVVGIKEDVSSPPDARLLESENRARTERERERERGASSALACQAEKNKSRQPDRLTAIVCFSFPRLPGLR